MLDVSENIKKMDSFQRFDRLNFGCLIFIEPKLVGGLTERQRHPGNGPPAGHTGDFG